MVGQRHPYSNRPSRVAFALGAGVDGARAHAPAELVHGLGEVSDVEPHFEALAYHGTGDAQAQRPLGPGPTQGVAKMS